MATDRLLSTTHTALVTGAAMRLGRAIALALAGDGVNVVVHYGRSDQAASETADDIRAMGADAWAIQADLAQADAVAQLFSRAVDLAGPIDILINNASIFPADRVLETTTVAIERNVQINAVAPLLLSRAMASQRRSGHIVNLLDSRVNDYDQEHAAYHLSKRMLLTLTRMLSMELAPLIAVNAVAPGLVLPPPGKDESYLRQMAHTNPLNRHGDAEDIAEAVMYLVNSRFVTGQVLFVDGGRHMKGNMYG